MGPDPKRHSIRALRTEEPARPRRLRPSRSGPPVEVVRADQRRRLEGAVVQAVCAGGYTAATARELCRLAGVSPNAVYQCYGSKRACLQAAYDSVLERLLDVIGQAAREQQQPRGRIAAVIEAFQRELCAEPPRGALLALVVAAEAAEEDPAGPMRLVDHLACVLDSSYPRGQAPPRKGRARAASRFGHSLLGHSRLGHSRLGPESARRRAL
ncbi:MAG: TetR/AcrR family transcriptional regulator [Solirubrobacteraceae bacterium]